MGNKDISVAHISWFKKQCTPELRNTNTFTKFTEFSESEEMNGGISFKILSTFVLWWLRDIDMINKRSLERILLAATEFLALNPANSARPFTTSQEDMYFIY